MDDSNGQKFNNDAVLLTRIGIFCFTIRLFSVNSHIIEYHYIHIHSVSGLDWQRTGRMLLAIFFLLIGTASAQPPVHPLSSSHQDFVDIGEYPNVRLDKRYSCSNNFCGMILDTNKFSCSLHPVAAAKFSKACDILAKEKPGWKFVVFDAFRPISVQRKLYQQVKGTPRAHYVAYPTYSIHCYGFAIDLSLADDIGKPVDMGTDFDDFSRLAEPRFEMTYLRSGKLTKEQYANRLLLRQIMKRAGFHQLQREWWHYEALPEHIVRARYKQLD